MTSQLKIGNCYKIISKKKETFEQDDGTLLDVIIPAYGLSPNFEKRVALLPEDILTYVGPVESTILDMENNLRTRNIPGFLHNNEIVIMLDAEKPSDVQVYDYIEVV